MKRYVYYILLCLLTLMASVDATAVTMTSKAQVISVGAAPSENMGFVSVSTGTMPSSSPVNATTPAVARPQSFSAISASNFRQLNQPGGACYMPSATSNGPRRVSRPGSDGDEDDEENLAIGEAVWRSPVGDTPWLFVLILATAFACMRFLRSRQRA